jgi:hypothetical protein
MTVLAAPPWRDTPAVDTPDASAADRCTAAMAAVTTDLFAWHRRGVTVRMVEPGADGGVRLGVTGAVGPGEAGRLLGRHYGFPVACYRFT